LSSYQNDTSFLQRVETILSEPGETGLGELVGQFFNTFNELTIKPESIALRQSLLNQGITMTDRFNQTAAGLNELRDESKKNSENIVVGINDLLTEISSLNIQILRSGKNSNGESQSLIDERSNRLEDLSKLIDTRVGTNEDGSVNVFTNGINILTGSSPSKLKLIESIDNFSGEKTLKLTKYDDEKSTSIDIDAQSGEIFSNLKLYNITLDDKDTSISYSIALNFHNFVSKLAEKVNNLSAIGYGLNDNTGNPPGRVIFNGNGTELNAFTITINNNLVQNPADLPLSSKVSEPGNSSIARMIGNLSNDVNFLKGQTPTDFYSNLLGKIGSMSKETINSLSSSQLIEQQLNSQRESVMGVNLDEEAVNLIKFQKAFEASSRIVATTNEILATIVNLGR